MLSEEKRVEGEVLRRIMPKESILPLVQSFCERISAAMRELGLKGRIAVGGSVAKDTYLAGDFDCDLFVRFDPTVYTDAQIASELAGIVSHLKLDAQLLHGSRDYFKCEIDGITYELVPTLDVSRAADAPNVTDMSLFHVEWTIEQCRKRPGLQNQIRLAKAFCKGQDVYGAESYIGGFSGHVVDILVAQYGSFHALLVASQSWKQKDVIDPQQHYAGRDALSLLNESKITSPIIIVDPIVPERNAASALTQACLQRFQRAAAAYLEKPSVDFFVKRAFDPAAMPGVGAVYRVSLVPRSDKKDIAGAQHVKVLEYLVEQCIKHEFEVLGSGWRWSADYSGELFIKVASDELSARMLVRGPPLSLQPACSVFRAVHADTFEKDGRLWANAQRKFSHLGTLLDAIASHELVRIRVKSFSWKKL